MTGLNSMGTVGQSETTDQTNCDSSLFMQLFLNFQNKVFIRLHLNLY
jgi:hypothetical protein